MYYVYILTNKSNSVLYTGVTNDLLRRLEEHRAKLSAESFTAKYNINKLVYYETTESVDGAILREKQIKAGSRAKKRALIESENPEWEDLSKEFE
ncbi:MAG: GIY-YIG nuclease family protein [Clostridia bacterium]|nr:GIY-YIG nuclease family protein [Clostridia bacterium]